MVSSFDQQQWSSVLLPADQRMRAEPARDERLSRMRRWAIPAAALFHVLLLICLWFIDRSMMFVEPPPAAIPVKVVYEQPPPPPAPKPTPPPQAAVPPPQAAPVEQPSQALGYRESGKDQETRAPRSADRTGPEEKAPSDQADAAQTQAKEKPAPAPAPRPEAMQALSIGGVGMPKAMVARPEPERTAREARAPQPAPPRPPNIELGDKAESGDPYLNQIQAMIHRVMYYPPQAAPLGLGGVVSCEFIVGRTGEILASKVVKSSGVSILDDAAIAIVRGAGPFPPLPKDYPDTVIIMSVIPMYPPGPPHG